MNFRDLIKANPPKGYTPIPGSKKGGYRKRSGSGWSYWYPDGKGARGEKPSPDLDAVTRGELAFYRGGGDLQPGSAYFISSEAMAGFYGPVTEHRLRLKRPKFVTKEEWGRFDSTMLRFDRSPVERLAAEGYDSAVWATDTPKGKMYTVFALDGLGASQNPATKLPAKTEKGGMNITDLIKANAPKGFTPVPNSKRGGYRKKSGTGYVYWYPDGKGTRGAAKDGDDKPSSAKEESGKRMKVEGAESLSEGVKERLAQYNLQVVQDAGSSPAKAVEIAKRLEEGISKASDICKTDPPVCKGNMGIPRSDMPQIMDEPVKDLLASKDEGERVKGEAAVAKGADPESDKSPFDMMLDHFKSEGIDVSEPTPIRVGKLKATQKDIKDAKATFFAETQMKGEWPNGAKADLSQKPIVISNDGHILDGHHRWAALLMLGPDMTMNAIKVDLPMHELLEKSFDVPGAGVFRMNLQNEVIEGDKPNYEEYKRKADANYEAAKSEASEKTEKSLTFGSIIKAFRLR